MAAMPRRRLGRLGRHVLRLAWVAAALLLVPIVLMWVRSYRVADVVHRFTAARYVELFSGDGRFGVRITSYGRPVARDAEELRFRHATDKPAGPAGPRGDSFWGRL